MKVNYMKKIAFIAIALIGFNSYAQGEVEEVIEEAAKKLSISGSVDTYFRTVLSASDNGSPIIDPDGFGQTSFADETGFALGMGNIIVGYESGKVGAVVDLVFGPRGDAAAGGYNLNQLYAYWNVSDAVTLTAGRFNTYLGYEVISPVGNFNYSTSYLFSNGPFSHVGLKADFALSDDFSLMLAVMNATDVNNNVNGAYSFGAQLGYSGQYLNFYYDDGDVLGFEVDYTGGFDIADTFYLGINAAYASNDDSESGFYGAALYPQFTLSDSFALGLRGEYFAYFVDDSAIDDSPVIAATLTGSYSVGNLMIKPEIRLDSWGNDIEPYLDNDAAATNSLSSFTIAAIYGF